WYLRQQRLDVLFERERQVLWSVTLIWHTIAIHQELGKVPLHEVAERTWQLRLQVREHRTRVGAVHVVLLEERELAVVLLHELHNLFVRAWLLAVELVAWERQDLQALVAVHFVKLGQLWVVGWRQATQARHVDNQHDLALVLAHWHLGALHVVVLQLVERLDRLGIQVERLAVRRTGVDDGVEPFFGLFLRLGRKHFARRRVRHLHAVLHRRVELHRRLRQVQLRRGIARNVRVEHIQRLALVIGHVVRVLVGHAQHRLGGALQHAGLNGAFAHVPDARGVLDAGGHKDRLAGGKAVDLAGGGAAFVVQRDGALEHQRVDDLLGVLALGVREFFEDDVDELRGLGAVDTGEHGDALVGEGVAGEHLVGESVDLFLDGGRQLLELAEAVEDASLECAHGCVLAGGLLWKSEKESAGALSITS
ncbi:TPA: hypothetical protein N0F65_001663, partial [Lagenidium giganteum]